MLEYNTELDNHLILVVRHFPNTSLHQILLFSFFLGPNPRPIFALKMMCIVTSPAPDKSQVRIGACLAYHDVIWPTGELQKCRSYILIVDNIGYSSYQKLQSTQVQRRLSEISFGDNSHIATQNANYFTMRSFRNPDTCSSGSPNNLSHSTR